MQMQVGATAVAIMLLSLLYLPLIVASEFGTSKLNGQTRLLGNSFGTPGLNRTFDYVVCNPQGDTPWVEIFLHIL
jgi:hypothetical protein